MFRSGRKKQPSLTTVEESVDTIVGAGTYFSGKLTAEGMLRVDGRVDGEIEVNGNIYLGESSVINADIICNNMTVAGVVNGMVTLSGKLHMAPTGKVFGDISVSNLVISDGAIFKGNCKMAGEQGETPGGGGGSDEV